MKKLILAFVLSSFLIHAYGQTENKHFSYTASIGTGCSLSQPSCTPFTGQIMVRYPLTHRFSAGAGTGVFVYEKALIPLYANFHLLLTRPRKLTPYLECNIGGSLAAAKETNGGFYLSPSVGAELRLASRLKMNFSLGYDIQKLERLKKQTDEYFHTEFKEVLSHHTLTFKVGLTY